MGSTSLMAVMPTSTAASAARIKSSCLTTFAARHTQWYFCSACGQQTQLSGKLPASLMSALTLAVVARLFVSLVPKPS